MKSNRRAFLKGAAAIPVAATIGIAGARRVLCVL